MHTLLVLLRKDFANFFRNKAAVSLTFIVPFAMIYVFGQVFGVNRKEGGPTGIPLAVVNATTQPAFGELVAALKSEKTFRVITDFTETDNSTRPLTEADLRGLMRENQFRFAVVIPAEALGGDGLGISLRIYSNPRNEIETQLVNGILQKTIFTKVPELLGQSLQARATAFLGSEKTTVFNRGIAENVADAFGGDADEIQQRIAAGAFLPQFSSPATVTPETPSGDEANNLLSQLVKIKTVQVAGEEVKSPAATRLVGGFAMQFLLFALSSSAAALFYERDRGIFHRILAGPVDRSQILWSKFLYGSTLGVLQLMILFVGGRLLYGIDIEHHLGLLTLVCVFAAAACTGFGMLLASLVSSAEAASGLATLIILVMCAVGGAWFPVSMMPEFIQSVSRLTIVYWAMQGFDHVLWMNSDITELLPTLSILGGITAGVMAIAAWRFNRGNLFA